MVLVKILKFFHVFIFGKISQQNVFDIFWKVKKHLWTIKNRKLKRSKNQDFSFFQRESMALVKNSKFFHVFIFHKKTASKMCLAIF